MPLTNFGLLGWLGVVAGGVAALFIAGVVYLTAVMAWSDRATNGLGYYGRSASDREAFRLALRRHAFVLQPLIRLLARLAPTTLERATFVVDGVPGPRGSCSEESFEAAMNYAPSGDDVFVVTQMKCGTTWMQHVVYEVLMRGQGDLVDTGTALYAVSRARIIKTHLPADACPDAPGARYIYVSRHPGSCFASCVDFLGENMGPFLPDVTAIEEWFRSPMHMWWGTWSRHVAGWWRRAQESAAPGRSAESDGSAEPDGSAESDGSGAAGPVLWVRFEEMTDDLPAVIGRVARFLGVDELTSDEVDDIVEKCGFSYMRAHHGVFEMHPPHLLAYDAELFQRGTQDRFSDLPSDVNERIVTWCTREVEGNAVPMKAWYPNPGTP